MKLKALVLIPIALLGVKRLQEKIESEPPTTILPLFPEVVDRPKQRDDGTFFGL